METFLAEMGLKNNATDTMGSSDNREPNSAITLLAEMETMKNGIEDVVSVKHASVSKIPEVNRNLLLDPVMLPKEASSCCQNIDPVMSSANNKLVEKGEEVLGETKTQLQPNNATIVDFQKGMHFCALSNTETNETIQHEFSSNPKVCSFDDDERQLKSKCPCKSYVDDQFSLKSGDQMLYLNNHSSSEQKAGIVANGNKALHQNLTKDKEQIPQIISSIVHLPPSEQRYQEELHDVECNKTSVVAEGINLCVSAQFSKTIQDVDMHSKNSPESQRTTESVELSQINPNVAVSETETNCVTIENFCMPLVEGDHVKMATALPRITQVSNTSTSLSSAECENGQHCVPCTFLETKGDATDKAVAPEDNSPLNLETKDENCCYLRQRNGGTLMQTSVSLDESLLLEGGTKPLENEKAKLVSTGSAITAKSSSVETKIMVKNLPLSTENNGSLVHEMKDCYEIEKVPAASEVKEIAVMSLSPISPPKAVLPKGSPPAVKPEKSSSPQIPSTTTSVLANNVFIFEGSICSDDVSKSVPNFEDQNLLKTSCFSSDDKQEHTNKSIEPNSDKICYSVSVCENIQVSKKSEIYRPLNSLTAAGFGVSNQISGTVQESAGIPESKVITDSLENSIFGNEVLLCPEETGTSGSCSLGSGSRIGKEVLVSTCEDAYTCKPASPSSCFKGMPQLYSTACETTDILGKKHSFSVNSEDRSTVSNHKSCSVLAGSPSETACSAPLVDVVASDVEAAHPVKVVLEKAFTVQHEKEMQKTPSEQVNPHCLIASVSENPVEMDDRALPALFTKSSSQFSDKTLKDVETGKQVQIRSQDLAVLLKKADEIVDAVLYLAIEEIQSKQVAGICRTNVINSSLLGTGFQKDQKMRKMLESKEIQLKNLSLTRFNETYIRRLSEITDTVDTASQDEIMPFDITNKIDLYSSQSLKAKEIIDDDINAAKNKLAYSQQEEDLSKCTSQNTVLKSKIEAPERLIMDTKLTDKLSETTKEPLSLSQVYPAEVHSLVVECEIASSLNSLHINDDKEVTRGEMVPNKTFAWQNYGDKYSDSTVRIESSPATVGSGKNSQGVNGNTHMTAVAGKMTDWTTDEKPGYSFCAGNGEAVMTKEQLPSCLSLPENVSLPVFNSDVRTYACLSNKSEGDLFKNDIRDDLPKYSFNTLPFFATEEPHGSCCETGSERGYGTTKKDFTELQDKSSISESSVKNNSPTIESNFAHEEEQKTGFTVDDLHKKNYLDSIKEKSSQCFAFSLPKELEGDSSFSILCEDSLREDSYSSAESEHSLPSLPGLSLNNIEHLLMYEAAKDKHNSGETYEDGNQVNEMLDSTCSESFMRVEAKRYRVYPFSLSPIYEDDSSQEDLLSTDISPGGHSSEKSRDSNNASSCVLSLLQSVSERLKSSNQYFEEEELCEENELEDKKGYIPSSWAGSPSAVNLENDHDKNLLFRHFNLSNDTPAEKEKEASTLTSVHSAQLLQKRDLDTKTFSRSVFYEFLQNAGSFTSGKGTRLESLLVTKDLQTKYNDLQKSGASRAVR